MYDIYIGFIYVIITLQRVSADESENIPNSPIKVLEENISDQSLYI